jgi:hypothetical protein
VRKAFNLHTCGFLLCRRIRTVNRWLSEHGYNISQLWSSIDDVIIKTLLSANASLRQNYRSCFLGHDSLSACFEILGFDILLDRKLKPYLLEVCMDETILCQCLSSLSCLHVRVRLSSSAGAFISLKVYKCCGC